MHLCLTIPELASTICSLVDEDATSDLIALAMTCKTLQNPALDALYYELKCLAYVFMCMPKSLWKITNEEPKLPDDRHGHRQRKLSFRRVMRQSDWLVLQKYLYRVRILRSDDWPIDVVVDDEVLSAVSCYCGASLFPSLRHLFLGVEEIDYFPCMLRNVVFLPRLLLGSRLTWLDLHGLESKMLPVLTVVADTSPLLQRIRLSFSDEVNDELLEVLEVVVHRLKKIQSVYLRLSESEFTVPTGISQILLTLESLSSLRAMSLIWFIPTESLHSVPSDTSQISVKFPALHSLHLRTQPLQVIQVMNTLQDLTSLSRLSIEFDGEGANIAMRQAVGAIASTLHSGVGAPICDIALSFPESDNTGLLSFDELLPLFCFRNLTHFSVMDCPHPAWDNSMLKQLARSLPNLLSLRLLWCRSPEFDMDDVADTNITFGGLASLLRHCPKLQTLGLAVDVAGSDYLEVEEPEIGHVCHTQLTHWQVYNSVIKDDDVDYAAQTIACLAPNVRGFTSMGPRECYPFDDEALEASSRQWGRIAELVACCRAARMHYITYAPQTISSRR